MLIEGLDLVQLQFMVKQYGGNGYAFQTCPTPLFAEIAMINHIRNQILRRDQKSQDELQSDAREVLRRIYEFSPVTWTESNEFLTKESDLIVAAYQSAVALYCMSSLSSVGALPPDPLLKDNCEIERIILHGLLKKGMAQISYGYLFWPLMVLGVQAVHGDYLLRSFVREKLVSMSATAGTYAPLAAKGVLEEFWESGRKKWDGCFEKPHMFTTVLTVNRGQLPRRTSWDLSELVQSKAWTLVYWIGALVERDFLELSSYLQIGPSISSTHEK